MAIQSHKNFSYSLVVAAPSPATSGTSLTVTTGQGALFPTPPFSATVWPIGVSPLSTNAEIVLVTLIVGDVLTITRAQESSTARSIIVGDQIAATITALTFTAIEGLLTGNEPKSYLVGTTANAPANGATTWVLADFANSYVGLFLNGQKVYNSDMGNGAPYVTKVLASTTVTLSQAFVTGDIVEYILIKSS